MRLGSGRYLGLLENIKDATYLGCNKYPNTLTSTYGLLVHHYGHMSNDRGIHSQGNYHLGGRGSGRTSVMFEKDTNNRRDDKYCILVLESDNTTSKVMCYN